MRYSLILLPAILLTGFISQLHATIIHVPGDSTTIQGGINGASAGDTVMVHPGTYYEHDIDFLGKAITVMGTDPEDSAVVAATVVDADSIGGVFIFVSGEDSTSVLAGLTITKGYAYSAGGIYCYFSSPTISNNIITGNSAFGFYPEGYGGGINCHFSAPIISNNTITENLANWRGGGIHCFNSSPRIVNNVITTNVADYGAGVDCYDFSSPVIEGNIISGNIAKDGAGIFCSSHSHPTIDGNTITENTSDRDGGGIFCSYYASPNISNNTISLNNVENGGGIFCLDSSSPTIYNNLILGNSAEYQGGGIRLWDSNPTITNNTIWGNRALSGGGLFTFDSGSYCYIKNTIFWNNTAKIGKEISIRFARYPSRISISYSDVEGGLKSIHVDENCELLWGDGMIDDDPLFLDPWDGNFELSDNSPCIDTGDPYSPNVPWGGWRRDMGAFEYDQGFYYNGHVIIWKPVEIEPHHVMVP